MLPGMSILAFTITIGRRLSPGPGRGLLPAGRALRRREPGNDADKLAHRVAERRGRRRASVRFATGAPGRFPAPFWHRHDPPGA